MPKLADEELALIAQALRSYSALSVSDATRQQPSMAEVTRKRSEGAAALAERIERARKQRPA